MLLLAKPLTTEEQNIYDTAPSSKWTSIPKLYQKKKELAPRSAVKRATVKECYY